MHEVDQEILNSEDWFLDTAKNENFLRTGENDEYIARD
jgi:hypothetical protein